VSAWRAHFIPRMQYASVRAFWHDYNAAERKPVDAGEGEPRLLIDKIFVDEPTARANARAKFGELKRESRFLDIKMPGLPELATQKVLRLEGFRDNVDGDWLIIEVTHTLSKSAGYTSQLKASGI